MKYPLGRLAGSCMGAALLALVLTAATPALAQSGKATPMTPDGHPDFSGFWVGSPQPSPDNIDPRTAQYQRTSDGSVLFDVSIDQGHGVSLCEDSSNGTNACQVPNQPPYNAEWMKKVKAIAATEFAGTTPEDPNLSCKPAGVPRSGLGNVQIFQTPTAIALVHGNYEDRIIYIGSDHPADMDHSYMGDSRGHWEGNTLVVDVAGLNDDTWLGGGYGGITIYTSIHSNKEHVVERYTRVGDEITYKATVDDPVALTKPWVLSPRKIHLAPKGEELLVDFCDGGGIGAIMKQHYVKPNPEDRDIKYKCYTHHCDTTQAANQPAK